MGTYMGEMYKRGEMGKYDVAGSSFEGARRGGRGRGMVKEIG